MTETRTLYESISDEDLYSAHIHDVGDGKSCVDGDMKRVTLTPIPWCLTHDSIAERTRGGHWLDECGDDPFYCQISTGGPKHRWFYVEGRHRCLNF